jgi:transposase
LSRFVFPARTGFESTIFTDEYLGYHGIEHMKGRGYTHRRINHSERVYVMGDIHTNTIEGFWSLVKRGISGVYHSVGSHYLQTYLNEYSFRYNRRFDTQPMFVSFLKQISKNVVAENIQKEEQVPAPF